MQKQTNHNPIKFIKNNVLQNDQIVNKTHSKSAQPETTTLEEYLGPQLAIYRIGGGLFNSKKTRSAIIYRFIICAIFRIFAHYNGNYIISSHANLRIFFEIYQWATTIQLFCIILIGIKHHDIVSTIMNKKLDKRFFGNFSKSISPVELTKEVSYELINLITSIIEYIKTGKRISKAHKIKRVLLIRVLLFIQAQITFSKSLFEHSYSIQSYHQLFNYQSSSGNDNNLVSIINLFESLFSRNMSKSSVEPNETVANLSHIAYVNNDESSLTSPANLPIDLLSQIIVFFIYIIKSLGSNLIYTINLGQTYGLLHLYLYITAAMSDMLQFAHEYDQEFNLQQMPMQSNNHVTHNACKADIGLQNNNKTMQQKSTRRGALVTTRLLVQIRDVLIMLRLTVSLIYVMTFLSDIFNMIWDIYFMTSTKGLTRTLSILDFATIVLNMIIIRVGHQLLHQDVLAINRKVNESDILSRAKNEKLFEYIGPKLTKNRGKNYVITNKPILQISDSERLTKNRLVDDICRIGPSDWFEPDLINLANSILFAITFVGTIQQLMGAG